MIYFAQYDASVSIDAHIKIGTTSDIRTRLAQLRQEFGQELNVLGVMEGSKKTEQQLHAQFAHLWRFGEWFRAGEDLLTFIRSHTIPLYVIEHEQHQATLVAQISNKHQLIRRLYYDHPEGLSDSELAILLGTTRVTAYRHRRRLQDQIMPVGKGKYTLQPTAEEIHLALATLKTALSSTLITSDVVTSTLELA